jgi:hypothetical protein
LLITGTDWLFHSIPICFHAVVDRLSTPIHLSFLSFRQYGTASPQCGLESNGEKISEKERFQPGNIPNSQVHYKLDLLFKFVSRLSINREIFGET